MFQDHVVCGECYSRLASAPTPPTSAPPPTGTTPANPTPATASLGAIGQQLGASAAVTGKRLVEKAKQVAQSQQVQDARVRAKTSWLKLTPKQRLFVGAGIAVVVLFVGWLVLGSGSSYTAESLHQYVRDDPQAADKKLTDTWITVSGQVKRSAYTEQAVFLTEPDTSIIQLSSDSDGFNVEAFYKGPSSNGYKTESLSRGDSVKVRGKVFVVDNKVVGMRNAEIVSVSKG